MYEVYTDEGLKEELERCVVSFLEVEGAVNGLNGILVGARQRVAIFLELAFPCNKYSRLV
ncbi:MAG TPA: hypothetical protein VM050_07930 [Patescibacteria group bacterium]|nr:hypothetical protein [Patescibacteria group bacterium]